MKALAGVLAVLGGLWLYITYDPQGFAGALTGYVIGAGIILTVIGLFSAD